MNKKLVLGVVLANASMFVVDSAMAEIEEVLVTARKRVENLQEVPIAITAFSAAQLEKIGISDISDLADSTSNMTFNSSESGRQPIPVIRGMGMIDTRGFDNNVSIFVDGAFVSGRSSQNVGMFDLERVEVVKGPQSALYGRNSFAGAINYVTKKPGDEFEGNIEVTVGDNDHYKILGALSGPLVKDKLSGRIAFDHNESDGTYKNTAPGGDGFGGYEGDSYMGTLRFTPNDKTDIVFSAFYNEEDADQLPLSIEGNNCGELIPTRSTPTYDIGQPYYRCGEVKGAGTDKLSMSPDAYAEKSDTTRFTLNMDFAVGDYTVTAITAYSEGESHGNMDLDRGDKGAEHYGWAKLSDAQTQIPPPPFPPIPGFMLALRQSLTPTTSPPLLASNFIPGAIPVGDTFASDTYLSSQNLDQNYWSQEVRIESNPEEKLRWSAGAFYFESESTISTGFNVDASEAFEQSGLAAEDLIFLTVSEIPMGPFFTGLIGNSQIPLPQPSLDGPGTAGVWWNGSNPDNNLTSSDTDVTQYAFFGSLEYDFTDKLTGTTELRWTNDERSNLDTKDDFFFSLSTYEAAGVRAYHEIEDDYWDPRFTLSYQASDDHMYYGSASHGTRSGGINPNLPITSDPYFDSEENWTYEVGAKTQWFDGRLQVNAAAFYIDWTDAQFRQVESSVLTKTSNSKGLEVTGFEVDFVYAPISGLLFSGGYGYSDAEFSNGTLATGGAAICNKLLPADASSYPTVPVDCVTSPVNGEDYPDMGGNMPRRSSKHTANLAAEYTRNIHDDIDGFIRLYGTYRSKQYNDDINVSYVDARTLVHLRAGIQSDNYNVTFWVKNLLDDDTPTYAQQFGTDFNSQLTTSTAVNPTLRRLGVTARYNF
jgi:iron complex outermembrane receptor protein